ncbi:hypothetical protein T4B_12548 [Trichinella pseudospiralis]|uniref:Uncharacterized protein n=1 Tax=Trichinella pseudospiralis TaxID=6337 RepID=A0A0V1J941_TRIPS|nr:hypothetical protein T4B_12548 [Trichinella pseudospiralis]KRZ31471.1 hypothetical protein T4C_3181 [Trichinella pseudospiralis]
MILTDTGLAKYLYGRISRSEQRLSLSKTDEYGFPTQIF